MRTKTLRGDWHATEKPRYIALPPTLPALPTKPPELTIAICGLEKSGQRELALCYCADWFSGVLDQTDYITRCARELGGKEVFLNLTYPRCEWLNHHDAGIRAKIRETFRNADGIFYLYDVRSRRSFDELEEIRRIAEGERSEGVIAAVVAAWVETPKTEWEVSEEAGKNVAKGCGVGFVSFDSKRDADVGVKAMVALMVKAALDKRNGVKVAAKKNPLAVLKRVLTISR